MHRFVRLGLVAVLLLSSVVLNGCVMVPARGYPARTWVPAHWVQPHVWVYGHWRYR